MNHRIQPVVVRARAQRCGAIVVLLALMLPVVIAVSAIAVNISYMHLVRTQMRIASDAAARAGSRTLAYTQDQDAAIQATKDLAAANFVGGRSLTLEDDQIELGLASRSTFGRWDFLAGGSGGVVNSVRVSARRDNTHPDGSVALFLPAFLSRATFSPEASATAAQLDRDIVMVLDRSGSMAESVSGAPSIPGPTPQSAPLNSRWRALEQAANDLLSTLQSTPTQERVSLVTFSTAGDTRLEVLLTDDYDQIRNAIAAHTAFFQGGWTAIGEGLQQALVELASARRRPLSQAVVIVMTDGRQNSGISPASVTLDSQIIYALTFSAGADQAPMQALAARGHGKHWHADNASELSEAFIEIGHTVPNILID